MKYEKQIFKITKTTFSMKEYYVASLVQMGIKEAIAVKVLNYQQEDLGLHWIMH